ncbi:MAG: hypothetical protein J3K34DRAFT_437616 [Monoraphidium minutum]|nr:MAG: hypothetical protein J3K34DRAFT_437616 [Monoraphidium minutum]
MAAGSLPSRSHGRASHVKTAARPCGRDLRQHAHPQHQMVTTMKTARRIVHRLPARPGHRRRPGGAQRRAGQAEPCDRTLLCKIFAAAVDCRRLRSRAGRQHAGAARGVRRPREQALRAPGLAQLLAGRGAVANNDSSGAREDGRRRPGHGRAGDSHFRRAADLAPLVGSATGDAASPPAEGQLCRGDTPPGRGGRARALRRRAAAPCRRRRLHATEGGGGGGGWRGG